MKTAFNLWMVINTDFNLWKMILWIFWTNKPTCVELLPLILHNLFFIPFQRYSYFLIKIIHIYVHNVHNYIPHAFNIQNVYELS
jgi:hypothetical protein